MVRIASLGTRNSVKPPAPRKFMVIDGTTVGVVGLTKGYEAIVDIEDYDRVMEFKWSSLIEQVVFEKDTHTYWDSSGNPIPSVTQLLAFGKIVNFDAVREEIRIRSMKRGTSVHWTTELNDLGALNRRTVPKALRGYLKAWRTWRERSGFQPVLIEKPFISPHGYAGTPDRFGTFPDGTWAVVDLKTGEGDIAAHVGIQLAPYAKWYAFTEGRFNIRRVGVKLHSDGTYRAKEFPVNRMPIDFCKFYECLVAWNKEKHGN